MSQASTSVRTGEKGRGQSPQIGDGEGKEKTLRVDNTATAPTGRRQFQGERFICEEIQQDRDELGLSV